MNVRYQSVRRLPTQHTAEEILAAAPPPWFYRFTFENGASTVSADPLIDEIHQVRADLVFPWLDCVVGSAWPRLTCLDIGCHEGWWSAQLAVRGARRVLGIDPRPGHIERAEKIRQITGMENLDFRAGNLYEQGAFTGAPYDLTLFIGLLYHLDNPVWALERARVLTRGVCVVETQVARPVPELECLWGSDTRLKHGPGIALVRSDEAHVEGARPLSMVPTLAALYEILYQVGFHRVFTAVPAPGMYSQYRDYDRVVVFALTEAASGEALGLSG
ncbi:MAG: methyltransferase domain-containing protein [Acidobacteria bacterium]|nr:methyltransferase domain-containing protein [Acidobacteriota bacterium]